MNSLIRVLSFIVALAIAAPVTNAYAASTSSTGVTVFGFTLFKRDARKKKRVKSRKYRRNKASKRSTKRKKYRTRKLSRAQARRIARAKAKRSRARRIARKRKAAAVAKRAALYSRKTVRYSSREKRGTIIVDTRTRHLYHVLGNGRATRYGVAVGKQGFSWSGTSRIRRKVKWPTWTPPREMIERKPELAKYKDGQPGGPANPLGAAALYLFQGKKDTLYRIHGTNSPRSIGRAASSGCIRMKNEDIQHLYARVGNGTKVIVR